MSNAASFLYSEEALSRMPCKGMIGCPSATILKRAREIRVLAWSAKRAMVRSHHLTIATSLLKNTYSDNRLTFSSAAGKAQGPLPHVSKKTDLQVASLGAEAIILIQGVLSASEAKVIIAAAERIGFEHQGSKGPAHGEVLHFLTAAAPGMLMPGMIAPSNCMSPLSMTFWALVVQAVRDNGRIAVSDKEYAQHLWEALGLQAALAGITVDGLRACGLNPNIRIYRCDLTGHHRSEVSTVRFGDPALDSFSILYAQPCDEATMLLEQVCCPPLCHRHFEAKFCMQMQV